MTIGSFLAYLLHAALFLAAGYGIYKLLLSRIKMPSFNRAIILAIYIMSLIAPALVNTTASRTGAHDNGVENTGTSPGEPLPATFQDGYGYAFPSGSSELIPKSETAEETSREALTPTTLSKEYDKPSGQPDVATLIRVACAITFAGGVVMLLRLLSGILSIARMRRRGECLRFGKIRLILLDDERINPFSLLNLIFMTRRDYLDDSDMIIEHELGHIRNMHCIDLMISKMCVAVMWWNPAAWLLGRELRAVHEYQADESVIRTGRDIKEYQLLLVRKAAGTKLSAVASGLNHSKLKQRFAMMYEKTPDRSTRLRAVAIIPAFCGIMLLSQQSTFASIFNSIADTDLHVQTPDNADIVAYDMALDESGPNGYLSLQVPEAGSAIKNAMPDMAMTSPTKEPAALGLSESVTPGTSSNAGSRKSVWDLDVLASNPKYIEIKVFDEVAEAPTINGEPVTFDQMEEYLRDTGCTSYIDHMNKMRRIVENKQKSESSHQESFIRVTDEDDDESIITVINEGNNQTIYVTPKPQARRQKSETRQSEQPRKQTSEPWDIQKMEAKAQALEAKAQAMEARAQAAINRKAAEESRKLAAKTRKTAAKFREKAAKIRKRFNKTNKTFSADGVSAEELSLDHLEIQLSTLEEALTNAEATLDSLNESLSDMVIADLPDKPLDDTPVPEKLSARFIRLDNTDGTNVQVMITSSTPLQIGSATMQVNGKRYNCSVKTIAEIHQQSEGKYNTLVKVHTRKLTAFTGNDYVSVITNRGTVKVKFSYR